MTIKEQVLETLYRLGETNDMLNVDDLLHIINMEVHEPQSKQLEWEVNIATAFVIEKKQLICYEIYLRETDCSVYCNDVFIGAETTLDEAKAYAQTHFEGLIKSCLEGGVKDLEKYYYNLYMKDYMSKRRSAMPKVEKKKRDLSLITRDNLGKFIKKEN